MNEKTGRLTCPAGAKLFCSSKNAQTAEGYRGIKYLAPKTACRTCKLRAKCLRSPKSQQRQLYYFHTKPTGGWANEMKDKIDTIEGRKMYGKRLKIVEPVFGNIRAQKELDSLTLRGRSKINIQWRLYCLVHNIEKILHFGKSWTKAA